MQRYITIFLFSLLGLLSYAQDSNPILNVYYQSFTRSYEEDVKPAQSTMILQMKGQQSVFFHQTDTIEFMGATQYITYAEAITKNYPLQGMVSQKDQIYPLHCYYEEPLPQFDWDLQDGDTMICDYPCKRAVATFRGRTWTAWYTEELPYDNGPWKLGGLPGLILKAVDKKGDFSYTAFRIRTSNGALHEYSTKGYKKVDVKQYVKYLIRSAAEHDDFVEEFTGSRLNVSIDGVKYVSPVRTACLMEYFNDK